MSGDPNQYNAEETIGFIINRLAFGIKTELQRAFKTAGIDLTPEQWVVMDLLWREEGTSQREIAERTFKDKPNITRILHGMERKELIRRGVDVRDRRCNRIFLTDKARRLREKAIPVALRVRERLQRGLDEADIDRLKEQLKLVHANLS